MLDIKNIGQRIKELRKERNLTQNRFAEELHVSFQAVSNWERGVAPPDLENILRIAKYFGILVDDLLRTSSEKLILGIDGGGTKTEFVVATQDGHVLKRLLRDGSNPNDIGFQKTEVIIGDTICDILAEFPSVYSVFCGIAGVSTGDNRRKLTEYLSTRYPTLKIQVNTDSANLFAMDNSADMVVICGTGSVVFVRQNKKFLRLGGWGYLLDTGGSAFDIGRDAIRCTFEEEEAFENPSLTSQLLREKLGVSSLWDATHRIYAEGRPYIASLSEVVFSAYKQGDPKAIAIINQNTERLAKLLNTGIEKYGASPRAVAGGGVFENNWEIMLSSISQYTETELILNTLPQVYGACRQALSELKETVPDSFYENFKATYRSVSV